MKWVLDYTQYTSYRGWCCPFSFPAAIGFIICLLGKGNASKASSIGTETTFRSWFWVISFCEMTCNMATRLKKFWNVDKFFKKFYCNWTCPTFLKLFVSVSFCFDFIIDSTSRSRVAIFLTPSSLSFSSYLCKQIS